MARKAVTAGTMLDRFRYAPGDGHVYVWGPGDGDMITVHRITNRDPLRTVDTGDRIPVPAQPTATAMAAAVALWQDGAR